MPAAQFALAARAPAAASRRAPPPPPGARRAASPRRAAGVTAPEQEEPCTSAAPPSEPLDLGAVMDAAHAAASPFAAAASRGAVVATGTGRQLGLNVAWRLELRADGAFREETTSAEMTLTSGFSGEWEYGAGAEAATTAVSTSAPTSAWEVDDAGCARAVELDDREALVLAAWVRGGAWTLPALRGALEARLLPPEEAAAAAAAASTAGSDAAAAPAAAHFVELRLRGGHLVVVVELDAATSRPAGMEVRLCAGAERWRFDGWRRWGPAAAPFPATFASSAAPGELQRLAVAELAVGGAASDAAAAAALAASADFLARFAMPPAPLLPADAAFDAALPPSAPAWLTPSGHLLVRPSIDGAPSAGFFLLDTGASGCVIEAGAADALGLPAFGELHVTGMAGKVPSRFRRAATLALGPLTVRRVAMMEMACGGLVRGAPGPVLGIVGFDVFRRAVVDIPALGGLLSARGGGGSSKGSKSGGKGARGGAGGSSKRARGGAATAEEAGVVNAAAAVAAAARDAAAPRPPWRRVEIGVHDPRGGAAACAVPDAAWQPVAMLSSVPYVRVDLAAAAPVSAGGSLAGSAAATTTPGRAYSCLLMVDTGAGGLDAMLNARAAAALGFLDAAGGPPLGGMSVSGVGGAPALTLQTRALAALGVGGVALGPASARFATVHGIGGGMELSWHAGGVLAGDALGRRRLVLDLARRRLALLEEGEGEEE